MPFRKVFYSLATLYFLAFYLAPAILLWSRTEPLLFGGSYLTTEKGQIFRALFLGAIFFLSFWLSFRFLFRSQADAVVHTRKIKVTRMKVLAVIFGIVYTGYTLLFVDANQTYAVRTDEAQGSQLGLLLLLFISNFGVFVAFKLDDAGLKFLAFSVLAGMIFVSIIGGGGRYNLLIMVVMIGVSVFKIRVNVVSAILGIVLIAFSIPIILNLKEVIYQFALGDGLGSIDFASFYNYSSIADPYLRNFGHPVFSVIYVEDTISDVGFRFFYDYLQGFLFYLRIVGVNFGDSLTYYNTNTLLGYRISIVPPGYVAFGFIQFHVVGVAVSGFFYALVGSVCNFVRKSIAPRSEMAKYYLAFTAANTFYHGEVRIIVMNVFIGLFFIWVFEVLLIRTRITSR